jgi:hypothetical protein
MFRIRFEKYPTGITLRFEGRFVSEFVEEAKKLILKSVLPSAFLVALSHVTFADAAGEEALTWFGGVGAKFVANSSYSLDLCERLRLRLLRKPARKRARSK